MVGEKTYVPLESRPPCSESDHCYYMKEAKDLKQYRLKEYSDDELYACQIFFS